MERHRIDLWLKLCCLFKHRAEATDACSGGHVKLNGERVKPSAALRINDVVEISGERYRKLVVLGLPEKNISRIEARTMYRDETPELPVTPEIPGSGERDRGAGRPTKKERRDIEKWRPEKG